MIFDEFSPSRTRRTLTAGGRTLRALGLDGPLTGVLAIIVCIGILVVYSASGQNLKMIEHHLANIAIAVAALMQQSRDAARTIAALLDLAAVGIEHAVEGIGAVSARG